MTTAPTPPLARSASWKWWVCGLLMLATVINYMDRLTVNQLALPIKNALNFGAIGYGRVEFVFGIAFAIGSLFTGWCVDRWNVRGLYALVVVAWSIAGFVTGFAQSLAMLLLFRFCLGLFEGGHWTCALRTTQRILPPEERTLGNSILQSGAAVGAILIPLVILALVDPAEPDSWRTPFFVVGASGSLWVVLWLASVRREDLQLAHQQPIASTAEAAPSLWVVCSQRRFAVLLIIVTSINLTWHFFRAWMSLFLQEHHTYTLQQFSYFSSVYYLFTDLGALSSGFVTLWLARRGLSVHGARLLVFTCCTLLTTLSVAVALVPQGPLLLALLLVMGFGALGLFPVYYSLSQELTTRHQGKVTGILGATTWVFGAIMHEMMGRWIEATKNYPLAVGIAGLFPLVGLTALLLLWKQPAATSGS